MRLGVAGPVVVVGLVLGVLITLWLKQYHGDPLGLVLFGHNFLALILAGMGAAVKLVCRRASVAGVTALLVAGTLTVIVFGDEWGDTRYSTPLFGALLLAGLEQRSRTAVAICVAAAAMSSFLVVGI